MNNLSKNEFRIQAIKALSSIVGKCYENNFYKNIRFIVETNRAWADFFNNDTKLSININSNEIKIRFKNWHNKEDHVYYNYSENDDHYEVLNKFKKDMIKNLRQCKKQKNHLINYKIYLYDNEIKNYDNKYYIPGGTKHDKN